jgi:hypothetical protein
MFELDCQENAEALVIVTLSKWLLILIIMKE